MNPLAFVSSAKRARLPTLGRCFLGLSLFSAVTVAAANGQDRPAENAKPAPREIIAAVPRAWPPQYGVDENGRPTGFAIDVMAEIAARAGVRVEYRVLDAFADVSEVMRKGEAHIIPNSGITPDRAAAYLFTDPVETVAVSIFVRSETTDIKGLEDLVGRKVAVVELNVGQKLLKARTDIEAVAHRDAPTALFDLLSGHEDALIFPHLVMVHLARKAGVEDRIKAVGQPLAEIKRAIRVQRSEPELFAVLDAAVKEFVGTPEYRRIYAKWHHPPAPFWTAGRVAWTMGGAIAVIFLLMMWWRYRVGVRTIQALHESEQQLRESEDLLNSIFENVPVGLLIKGPDHVVERANSTYLRWYGFDTETMAGRRSDEIEDFQSAEEAEQMNDQEREVLTTGLTKTRQVDRPFADGQIHTIHITKFPVYDQHGTITKVGSVSIDLTEQVEAQKLADDALQEAETANRAKSDFLALVSHDLRTPLNAILGFADILKHKYFGPADDRYQEYADDIQTSGQHLLTLVNEILDLSTIEAGKQSLIKERLSTTEIVGECRRIVEDEARSQGVDLVTEIPKDLPPLYADKRASMQILLNLLSNAVKFTPEGGKVTVSATASRRNTTLKIIDTGKGIAADKLPRLTEAFTRADADPYLAEEGWGLGLAITKSLIELHDGRLDIKSTVGRGTTVTVMLPNER